MKLKWNVSQSFLFLAMLLSIACSANAAPQFVNEQFQVINKHFQDDNLEQLLKLSELNQTSGVIWVWSPRMNLSIYGLSELKPIAALLDLELTVLVDPHHPEMSIYDPQYASLFSESLVMRSKTLEKYGALLHFPVLIVYKNGKLLLPNRPGYDEPERLYRYLVRRLL